MSLLIKIGLTALVWLVYIALVVVVMLWLRGRSTKQAMAMRGERYQSHLEEWVEGEVDDVSAVGGFLMAVILVIGLLTLFVPGVLTWKVWGGGDGCPSGQTRVETGTASPVVIKGVTYWVPDTVCVLENR